MSKTTGLGHRLAVGGYDLSGDIGSLSAISGGNSPLMVTGIDKSAPERIGGKRDGKIEFQAWFNPAASAAHPALSALPTGDVQVMYGAGTSIGSPAACLVGKQVNYDPTRGADGSLTLAVQAQATGYGLEWAQQLTAWTRTDTGATNGSSLDTTASAAFGAQAYLQVTAFSGTDVTIKIQDSANDSAFSDVTGLGFTAVTTAPGTQRLATAAGATVRRYLRVATTTSGGFTSVTFVVAIAKNAFADAVF